MNDHQTVWFSSSIAKAKGVRRFLADKGLWAKVIVRYGVAVNPDDAERARAHRSRDRRRGRVMATACIATRTSPGNSSPRMSTIRGTWMLLIDVFDFTVLAALWLLWIVIAVVTLPVAAYRWWHDCMLERALTERARRRVDRIARGRRRSR